MDFTQTLLHIMEDLTPDEQNALLKDPSLEAKIIMKKKNIKDPKLAKKLRIDTKGKIVPADPQQQKIAALLTTKVT